jgi:IS5 family transposase
MNWTPSGDMGRLKNLAQMFRDFATNHVAEPDVPAAPDGADGYAAFSGSQFLLTTSLPIL